MFQRPRGEGHSQDGTAQGPAVSCMRPRTQLLSLRQASPARAPAAKGLWLPAMVSLSVPDVAKGCTHKVCAPACGRV